MTSEDPTPDAPKAAAKPKQVSYFAQSNLNRFFLDDVNYIEHKMLDEGTFQRFQDLTSTIKIDRDGDNTEVDMALGKSRKFLLENLVSGWNLVGEDGNPAMFSITSLLSLPPHIIGKLVADIYDKNPVLKGDSDEEEKKDN